MIIKFLKTLFFRQQNLPEQEDPFSLPAVTLVRHRYEFYRDQSRLLLKVVFVESIVLAASWGLC